MVQTEFDIKKIKLIVGLGNVGKDYVNTRHNAGFLFLDHLSNSAEFSEKSEFRGMIYKMNNQLLVKPTTLMNLSGEAVHLVSNYYKINPEEILIAHDDLDIVLGQSKIQFGVGPKEHNGIISIENHLGTKDFWRFRIGIDNRTPEEREHINGHDYVLGRFREEEIKMLQETFSKLSLE